MSAKINGKTKRKRAPARPVNGAARVPRPKLVDFLHQLKTDSQRARFALQCKTSVSYLYNLGYGVRKPTPEMAARIELASKGELSMEYLRPDLKWLFLYSKYREPVAATK
jgi:DNA-binding transcriptional regulator YdaS (Cro superfamily)